MSAAMEGSRGETDTSGSVEQCISCTICRPRSASDAGEAADNTGVNHSVQLSLDGVLL